jgi:hypothetical protein
MGRTERIAAYIHCFFYLDRNSSENKKNAFRQIALSEDEVYILRVTTSFTGSPDLSFPSSDELLPIP